VILGLLVVIGGPLWLRRTLAADKRRTALIADPRYAAVVQAFNANYNAPYDERLQRAADSLIEQGIPPQQAYADLKVLVGSNDGD
jgi:catalase (peroxidase I)